MVQVTVKGQISQVEWLKQAPFNAQKVMVAGINGREFPAYRFEANEDTYSRFQTRIERERPAKVWSEEAPVVDEKISLDDFMALI